MISCDPGPPVASWSKYVSKLLSTPGSRSWCHPTNDFSATLATSPSITFRGSVRLELEGGNEASRTYYLILLIVVLSILDPFTMCLACAFLTFFNDSIIRYSIVLVVQIEFIWRFLPFWSFAMNAMPFNTIYEPCDKNECILGAAIWTVDDTSWHSNDMTSSCHVMNEMNMIRSDSMSHQTLVVISSTLSNIQHWSIPLFLW